jgi:hypothetical protein
MHFLLTTIADDDNPVVGDLKLTNGQITLTPDLKTAVAQSIVTRLRMFFGEWFMDTREGVPWIEVVFVKAPSLPRIMSIFRAVILETPGVSSIARLSLDFNKQTRVLTVADMQVRLNDGAVLTAADFGPFIVQRENDDNAA